MKRTVFGLKIFVAAIFILSVPLSAISQTAEEYYQKALAIVDEIPSDSSSSVRYEIAKKAADLFIKACELDAEVCIKVHEYGFKHDIFYEFYDQKNSARAILEKHCHSEKGKACIYIFEKFHRRDDVPLEVSKNACEAGHGFACFKVGESILKDSKQLKEQREALPYYEKACELEYSEGCIKAADMHMGSVALEIPSNEDKILYFYQKLCKGGSCGENFKLKLRNIDDKLPFALKLCELEGTNGALCETVGEYFFQIGESDLGEQYYQKTCDLGHYESCLSLADRYYNGKEIQKNLDKAFQIYENYVRKVDDYGKGREIMSRYAESNYQRGISLFQTECNNNHRYSACLVLINEYTRTAGLNGDKRDLVQNLKKALEIYKKACEGNYAPEACSDYQIMQKKMQMLQIN